MRGTYPPPVPLPTSGWGSTAPPVALSLRYARPIKEPALLSTQHSCDYLCSLTLTWWRPISSPFSPPSCILSCVVLSCVRQALPSHYQGRGARRAGWGLIRCEQHRLKFPKIHLNKNSIILQFVIKSFHNLPAPSLS